ncbi:hypothetical protein [Streptomyces formicae]|uniref:hypothetical protein n=1 Tax=Streptomyces formicae TaxID=1616117 RepID=UPI003AA83BBF
MLALDHPPPPKRVGGLYVSPIVTGSAYLHCVGTTVPAHEVAYRVLEVSVVEPVELGQLVPQVLRTNAFPACAIRLLLEPETTGASRDQRCGDEHPPVRQQPLHHCHDESHARNNCDGEQYRIGPFGLP